MNFLAAFSGEVVLSPGQYSVHWIIINKKGRGFGGDVNNASQIQQIIDKVTGQPND